MRATTLLVLPLLLGACSLSGFDEVTAEPCLAAGSSDYAAGNARCRTLEAESPSSDACLAWVCALQVDDARYCALAAPDDDDDGVGALACLDDESADRDCDDTDADITGRSDAEICDGKDNDCDALVDEGWPTLGEPTLLLEESGTAAARLAWNRGLDPVVAFRQDDELAYLRGDGSVRATGVGLRVEAEDPGLALAQAATTEPVYVAYVPRGACQALAVGVHLGTGAWAAIDEGLPDELGEDCSDSTRTGSVAQPTLGAQSTSLLAGWLDALSSGSCGESADTTLTLAAAIPNADGAPSPRGTGVSLGEASSLATPAILALDDDEYLVAWSRGEELAVARVRVGSAGLETSGAGLETVTIPRSAQDLRLARSADGAEALLVATGCEAGSAHVLALGEGLARGADLEFGATAAGATPRVIASPAQAGFVVAWMQGSAVFAELLQPSRASAPVGPSTQLVEGGVSGGYELYRADGSLRVRYYGVLDGVDGFVEHSLGCGG